jgi:hypothetical protein
MITLELTLPETNLVLEALGALPYARVYELIRKIHEQAEAAVAAAAEAAAAEAAEAAAASVTEEAKQR